MMSCLAEASLKEEFRHRNAYFSSTTIFIGCVHGDPMTAVTRILYINNGPELVWEHLCDHYNHISHNGFADFNNRFVAHCSTDIITILSRDSKIKSSHL